MFFGSKTSGKKNLDARVKLCRGLCRAFRLSTYRSSSTLPQYASVLPALGPQFVPFADVLPELSVAPGASNACWRAACRDSLGKKRNRKGSPGTGRKQVNPVSLKSLHVQKKPLLTF